jgi:hypothetical protein
MSNIARRLSNPTDAVKRLTSSSTGSAKRADQGFARDGGGRAPAAGRG